MDETKLTAWMADHLRVTTWATDDVDQLGSIMKGVLGKLNPPANLNNVEPSKLRTKIRQLRKAAES